MVIKAFRSSYFEQAFKQHQICKIFLNALKTYKKCGSDLNTVAMYATFRKPSTLHNMVRVYLAFDPFHS